MILVSGALLSVGPAPVTSAPAWGGVALALGLITAGWFWRRRR